jgi:hypothetical protein
MGAVLIGALIGAAFVGAAMGAVGDGADSTPPKSKEVITRI